MADEAKQSGQVDEILNDFNRKNSTLMILIIVFVVITLLGGGGAAYFFLFAKKGGEGTHEAARSEVVPVAVPSSSGDKEMIGVISRLDPFIVNLNEVDASRYLKVVVELEVTSDEAVKELSKRTPQVRDLCVGVLSSKSFADIQGADGKYRLKEELMFAINKVLAAGQVKRIYFTQFVVQ